MSTSSKLRAYHHGDLRRAILEAALEMLEQEGSEGLGLRELARRLGVSPAAPYRHFDSRLALLEALAVTGYQRFAKAVKAAAEASPADPLRAMGRAYVRFALDNGNLFRLMFSPELERSGRPSLRMAADAAFASLAEVTAAGGRLAALKAWAEVHGLAVLLLDRQIALRPGEDPESLAAAILDA